MVYLIEIYRFIIALSIVFFHFMKTLGSNTNNLRLGVDFFILSGFYLLNIVKNIKKNLAIKLL